MAEQTLAPEVLERVRRQLLQQHPEMEGAVLEVTLRHPFPDAAAIAAKAGLPAVDLPSETYYVITLHQDVETEDGFRLPMIVRVTVDEQGNLVKKREAH
jgi:hypothetical protein